MGHKSHSGLRRLTHMPTGPARILYIEDNADNRLLVKRVLEAEGYQLLEAANAHDGLRQVLAQRPALILMDINLPDVDGYTSGRHVVEVATSSPKIALIVVVTRLAQVVTCAALSMASATAPLSAAPDTVVEAIATGLPVLILLDAGFDRSLGNPPHLELLA